MLHYSYARSIEKNRRYLVIKGGLAWLLWQEGGVANSVVELGPSGTQAHLYRDGATCPFSPQSVNHSRVLFEPT